MEKNNTIILIVSGLILILSVGVVYFLAIPEYKQVGVQDLQISQVKSQIEAKKNYYITIDSQSKALEDAGWVEKKKTIEVNFTSTPFYIPKMNIFFQTVVTASGMFLSNITSSSPVPAKSVVESKSTESDIKMKGSLPSSQSENTQKSNADNSYSNQLQGPVNKISFNVAVTGTYDSFKKFLSDLETQTRIVTVKSISVSPSNQGSGKKSLNTSLFNLVVDTYSY
jgi:hypothetical protein